jgi:small conductance mechanosensitive channel
MDWEDLLNTLYTYAATWGIRIVGVLVALFFAWVFAGWVQRAINKRLGPKLDPSLTKFFASLIRYAIIAGAVVGCLGVFGIQTASFAAVIAAAGLAIGLAFQGTLSNFAAGVMLLVFRPFKVGDLVNLSGMVGVVEEIDLFTSALNTPDFRRIIIPNGQIVSNIIENLTNNDRRRVDIAVGVDYGADVDEVREVLEKCIEVVPKLLEDPEPQIFLSELGASSVDWQVRLWCDPSDYWDVHQAGIRAAKKALDEAGISIPFPQQDVHLDPEVLEAIKGGKAA